MDGLLEGLVSDIEEESSLILLVDAHKESIKVEVVSEGFEESLEELGLLLSLGVVGEAELLSLVWRSDKDMSCSLTAVLSEVEPLLGLVVGNGTLDFLGDLDTVVNDITSDVPGKGDWASEGFGHLGELLPVGLDATAVLHGRLDELDNISDILDTGDDVLKIFLLELGESVLSVMDDALTILDAVLNIRKALSIKCSHKEALDNLNVLLSTFGFVLFAIGVCE